MQYRSLGRMGWQVSEIGFGAWGIGRSFWVGAEDKESLSALHAAVDAGVNFIDTALVYGDGHSETLVGQVVRERAERIYVATKVPPLNEHWPALPDDRVSDCFPPDHIITSTEQSLKSLKLDCVDLQQLHVWRDEWMEDQRWLEALHKLKQQGKVRAIGVSINDHEPETALTLVTSGVIDTVQVIYSIFDQSPNDALLPACIEHDVGVLARCPFDEGALTGAITADTDSDTEARKCTGFQPTSAFRLIAMTANFGVVNCMKMSAPEALSLAIWASMVVSVTLYAASATIGTLPPRPSFRPLT